MLTLASCVSASAIRNPEAPGPDWFVYSSATTGLAIALPKTWRAFDLSTDGTSAPAAVWARGNTALASKLEPRLQQLVRAGNVRFFAADTDAAIGGEQTAIAYVVRGQAPQQGLDAAALASQPPGRRIVEQRHVNGNGGDLLMLKIEESTTVTTVQFQFLTVRGSTLHGLFIELPPGAIAAGTSEKAQKIGLSFTPIG